MPEHKYIEIGGGAVGAKTGSGALVYSETPTINNPSLTGTVTLPAGSATSNGWTTAGGALTVGGNFTATGATISLSTLTTIGPSGSTATHVVNGQFNIGGSGPNTIALSGSSAIHEINGRTTTIQSVAGASAEGEIRNNDNTNGGSHARMKARSGGASGGDPYSYYEIAGVIDWAAGIDNSDGDKYKISNAVTLGTNDYFSIDTAGLVTIGTGTSQIHAINGSSSATVGAAGSASALPANPSGYLRININGTIQKIPYYAD